jgi:hypothetical protein
MDDRVARLKSTKDCETFIRNATERDRADLAAEARERILELRGDELETHTEAETEALRAVHAYEQTLFEKHGKHIRASYTWRMIREHGVIEAVERAVKKPTETQGFRMLDEMGLGRFSFEAVILRHPEAFSAAAVATAEKRMTEWGAESDT